METLKTRSGDSLCLTLHLRGSWKKLWPESFSDFHKFSNQQDELELASDLNQILIQTINFSNISKTYMYICNYKQISPIEVELFHADG